MNDRICAVLIIFMVTMSLLPWAHILGMLIAYWIDG